jgi:ribosome assembly protein YihI (activator of Der GTPase)
MDYETGKKLDRIIELLEQLTFTKEDTNSWDSEPETKEESSL